MTLVDKTARTLLWVLVLQAIVPTHYATIALDDQSATLPDRSRRMSRHTCRSTAITPYECGSKAPAPHNFVKQKEYALALSPQHLFNGKDSRGLSVSLAKRSPMGKLPIISNLVWTQLSIVDKASKAASQIYTQFYSNITVLASRQQLVSAGAYTVIFGCGAIKLAFEIRASERPISWHVFQDFILDFAKLMLIITGRVMMASFMAVVVTIMGTFIIALHVVEHGSRANLITGPVV